jgi:two-component system, chemotaxis family, response regulator Rcp1
VRTRVTPTIMRPLMLLVEDNPGDVRLTREAIAEAGIDVEIALAADGERALRYLAGIDAGSERRPDLVLLDLNLPRVTGHEVLATIKNDTRLRRIPTLILSVSSAAEDVERAYGSRANCYIVKPLSSDTFTHAIAGLGLFWFTTVTLPPR